MPKVVTSKDKKIVVQDTGHPAAFRKVRCPKCKLGYAVQSNTNKKLFNCTRCGSSFEMSNL